MELMLILWVLCAGLCAYVAHCTGRSVALWTVIGFVFGLLGPLFLVIAIAVNGQKES